MNRARCFRVVSACIAMVLLGFTAIPAQVCETPPADLVSWWPADGDAADFQDGNHGTLQNGATYAAGKVGGAFSLDGVDDYVEVPDAPNLDLAASFTIEAWVNPASCPTGGFVRPIVTKETSASWDAYTLYYYGGTGKWHFAASDDATSYGTVLGGGTCTPGVWYHLVVTQDLVESQLFINGVSVSSDPTPVVPINTSLPLNIGYREDIWSSAGITPGFFDGLVDEVTIYDRALTPAEVLAIYNAGTAGKCKAPLDTINLVFGPPYAAASSADHGTSEQFIGAGSWSKTYPAPKFEMYIDPVAQFGTSFTVGEIRSISYHTVNDATNSSDVDFYLLIYTEPYAGGDASWYGNRLNAEPLYSNGYVAPTAGVWNAWTTNSGANQLTFFDANHCANFGFYGGPTLLDLKTGPITWSSYAGAGAGADPTPIDYASQTIKYLNISTGNGWSTFDGDIDAITVYLTNGDAYVIDLESATDPVYVDDNWAGMPPGVEVEPGKFFGFNAFATVQDGIDNVANSTVYVAAGTYTEQVYIDASLDLIGAGMGVSIIEAPDAASRTTYSITQWTGSARTIDAIIGVDNAGTVNITGFTIDGRDTGPNNYYGVHYFNTGGSVTSCSIENVTYSASPGAQRVASLVATHGVGESMTIDFSDNVIPNFQKGGILIMGPGATFTVDGNAVTNVPSPNIAGNGIQLSYGASGTTSGNVVEGAAYTGADWAATGILLFESGDIAMDGDEVRNCQSGVNYSDWGWVYSHAVPVTLSFSNLNLHGNEWTLGIQLSRDNSDVNMTVTDCDILGSTGDGIDFYATGVDPWGGAYYAGWSNGDLNASVTGCYISGTTLDGIWGGDYSGNANNVAISVSDCMFTGNVGSAINNDFTQMMDASGCYWDNVSGPTLGVKSGGTRQAVRTPKPFGDALPQDGPVTMVAAGGSDKGTGEAIYGSIDYTPWLGGGTPTSPGFDGDFSTLYVDDDSPQAGSTGRVQEGVDLVTASTVYLSPGTYEGQVEITSDMTIIGAGIGTTIIQSPVSLTAFFTTSANNYPIVFIHDADNVTIQDLTVDGLGRGNTNVRFMGIGYNNAGGTVDNVEIRDVRNTPFSGSQHGVALYVYNDDGAARTITVSNSDFHGFQKNAMALNASATTPLAVDVHHNTVTGYGPTDITAQNGIQVWADLGTGSIAHNTVSGIAYDNTASAIKWVATTILNYYADLSIVSNNLSEGHVGVYNIDGSGQISNNHIAIEKVGVYAWGIIASDPPKAVPAGFDNDAMSVSAKRMPGSSYDVTAAAVVTVDVSGNVLSFSGPDNTATYGIEADAGYGPDDIAFTASNNLVTDFGEGIVIWECESGCAAGIYTLISVTDNRLSNTSNTYDNSTGGLSFWNHNCYSDLTANAGWPPNYNTAGPAGAIDVDPDVECCYIDDTLPPVITFCPEDMDVVCRADIPACDPGAVVATDDFGPITITCTDGPLVGDLCSGTITRTYQAIDSCGNLDECTQVFTIGDEEPPTISCPPNITVLQFLDLPPCDPGDATVGDNCGVALVTCERSEVGGIGCADDEVPIVYTYTVFDSCGNSAECQRTVTVLKPDCPFFVRAGGPDGDMDVLIGQQAVIPVHIDALSIQIGSFDLAMTYNSDAVAILGVDRGEAIEAWEYFTYRLESSADGSDQIHLVALADLDNGAVHPPESAYMPTGPIAYLRVAISPDRQFAGETVAFDPYLGECHDNTVVSRRGDMTLVMAQSNFDACADQLTGMVLPGIGFQGARLIIAEPSNTIGDMNLNGMAYEVGDAILFTNFLVHGGSVLHSDPALRTAQILASDVNGDGMVLTVGDLIYLIRVLTGDADPLSSSKLSPYASAGSVSYRVEDGVLTVSSSSPLDLGGALMVFRYSGMGVGTPVVAPAASGLTLTSTAGRGELRVLLSTAPTAAMMASVPAGTHDLFTVPVEGDGRIELVETQMSDAQGALMTTFVAGVSIPESFVLLQNYPNPFNAGTVLPFELKREGAWSLTVYNVAGQVVRTFAGHDAAGRIQVSWDGRNDQGVATSSGVYFYRLTAGDYTATRKMTLLK